MRTAFATMILAAGLVSVAQAQDAPPAPPATAPAPAAGAPATPGMSNMPMGNMPGMAPAAPGAAAPAAPAAEAPPAQPAAPAEAPPTLPTSGDAAVLISTIDKICVPLVRGGNLDALAKATPGMKLNRRDASWTMPLGGDKAYTITIFALGSNKDVCRGEIHYAIGQTDPLVKGLVVYAFLHQPELILQANYVQTTGDGIKRVQRSWEHLEPNAIQALNFTTLSKPDDTPTAKTYQVAEFYYQERKLP
jgi:hypothetical protein